MGSTFLAGMTLSFFIFGTIASFFLYKATKKRRWIFVMICSQFFSVAFIAMNWPTRPSDQPYRDVLRYIESQANQPTDGVTT